MKELKFCESSIKCDIDPKEKNFTPINYELLLETIAANSQSFGSVSYYIIHPT